MTSDEISEPGNLRVELLLNGQRLQDGNTRELIFDVAALISYISALVPSLPGDIIATGTPAGVGFAQSRRFS